MPGLTHIYCGDGKGKTTAALGLPRRAERGDRPVEQRRGNFVVPFGDNDAERHFVGRRYRSVENG